MLARLERFREHDMPWRDGRTFAYAYDPGREAQAVIQQAFASYLGENALDPTVFPSALRLENAGALPRRMAEIDEALNALPVALRERLLVEFLNGLFRQPGTA